MGLIADETQVNRVLVSWRIDRSKEIMQSATQIGKKMEDAHKSNRDLLLAVKRPNIWLASHKEDRVKSQY